MKLGFKTGPKNWETEGRDLLTVGALACEVWFDVRRADEYQEMLAELQANGLDIGLHHWGLVEDKYKTNLATKDDKVRLQTIHQIKETIDWGERIKCGYVNAHPGARWLEELQFSPWQQRLVSNSETASEQARELFLRATAELQTYAQERGVLLTIETLPALEVREARDRHNVYNPENVPLSWMEEMVEHGVYLANDITHTAGQLALVDNNPDSMWGELLAFSKRTANKTGLLHINTVAPPFNGTDSHDGITDEDFARGVFPSKDQMREWLEIFADRDDVFVIPEPQHGTTRQNFTALEALVKDREQI